MSDYFEDKNGVVRKRKAACKHGHPFDGTERWHVNHRGYKCRVCRVCARLRMERKRANPKFKEQEALKARRWRKAHPERYKEVYRAEFEKRKRILLNARVGGCITCGELDPACLDFHHRDPSTKEGHIGEFRKFGLDRLFAEIAKCDVLCSNCHRKHHRDERQQA